MPDNQIHDRRDQETHQERHGRIPCLTLDGSAQGILHLQRIGQPPQHDVQAAIGFACRNHGTVKIGEDPGELRHSLSQHLAVLHMRRAIFWRKPRKRGITRLPNQRIQALIDRNTLPRSSPQTAGTRAPCRAAQRRTKGDKQDAPYRRRPSGIAGGRAARR